MHRDAVMTNDGPERGDTHPALSESGGAARSAGFFRRYRLPLLLGLFALCLYAGSIVYIIYIRVPAA